MNTSIMSFAPRAALIASALWLAGCTTLQPDAIPGPDLPMRFVQAGDLPAADPAQADGWAALGDPALDQLMARGLAANLDLQQAAERIARSRALADGSRAAFGPSGDLSVEGQERLLSRHEAPGLDRDARRSDSVGAGLGFAWEIDLFGRLRHQAAAAAARVEVSAADAEALRLAIGAEIAQAWFALTGAREQATITRRVIDNRRATLTLVQRRTASGFSAPLDEARARAELAAAEADRPLFESAEAVATHRLAVLLGESPSGFVAPDHGSMPPQQVRLHIPAPQRWAAQHPDLRAAEAELRALALDVAAVRTEFLPSVSITGMLGFVAGSLSGLGAAGSASWFVAPSVSLPLFDYARIDARLAAASSGQREALLAYRQRVLIATEEVENALVRVRQGQIQLAALHERASQAAIAESLARRRYQAGASDLLELLDAQRGAQHAELGLTAALSTQRQQIVALHRALGTRLLPEKQL